MPPNRSRLKKNPPAVGLFHLMCITVLVSNGCTISNCSPQAPVSFEYKVPSPLVPFEFRATCEATCLPGETDTQKMVDKRVNFSDGKPGYISFASLEVQEPFEQKPNGVVPLPDGNFQGSPQESQVTKPAESKMPHKGKKKRKPLPTAPLLTNFE